MAEADAKEADASAEASAPATPKPKSALVKLLINGAGIFALSLAAVVAGGFINALLHREPVPEYVLELDKDGRIKDGHIKQYVPPEPKKKPEPKPKKEKKKEEKKVEKKPAGPALFYSLDPALVVNFEEASTVRFLQVGIDIMAREQAAIEAVQKHTPMIRNNLLLVISNRDYKKLMTREGKDELRKEALAEVKKILKKETGEANVEDLLFTSFVVQ